MYQNDNLKCLLKNVRLSYCNLIEPRTPRNGGEPKYSVTLLIPKSDAATKADIDSAIQAAMLAGKDKVWKGVLPPNPHIPIHDGDGLRESGEPFGEECRGCWVITASSKLKPEIVDSNLQPIINPTEIYSGMYAHVTIRFFAYSNSGNKGIGCGLGNIMKTADGEPLGGRTDAATDFAGLSASPQQAQGQSAPQYPQNIPQMPAAPHQYAQAAQKYQQYAIDPITGQPMQR